MLNKRLFAKIKAYQGNEKLPGEVKLSIAATKKTLGILRADWNIKFLDDLETFLEPVISIPFKNELQNGRAYEIGVFANKDSPEKKAKFLFEGEIVKVMALTMGMIGDGKKDEENRKPTIVFQIQSNGIKFKDFFPQNINTGIWIQINYTEEPDLMEGDAV